MGDEEVMAGGVNYFLKKFGRDEKGREKKTTVWLRKAYSFIFSEDGEDQI